MQEDFDRSFGAQDGRWLLAQDPPPVVFHRARRGRDGCRDLLRLVGESGGVQLVSALPYSDGYDGQVGGYASGTIVQSGGLQIVSGVVTAPLIVNSEGPVVAGCFWADAGNTLQPIESKSTAIPSLIPRIASPSSSFTSDIPHNA